MTNRKNARPQARLSPTLQLTLSGLESLLYGAAGLLLVIAAVFLVIATGATIVEAVTTEQSAIETGVLVLDRILLILIVAELAYTLRMVVEQHSVAAEPFLFIGVIAVVRRILIVTAEFEKPQTEEGLFNLLLELGLLGVLVLALAAAIFLIRHSAAKAAAADRDKG